MVKEKKDITIRFWGVRGSIPTPAAEYMRYGGNTSCVEIRVDNRILIFDAGTGIKDLGISLADEFGEDTLELYIFISHTHWDHIQGLPFFRPLYMKNTTIHFYGGHFYSNLEVLLDKQMEKEFFPISMKEAQANCIFHEISENPFYIDDIMIYYTHLLHPTLSLGFRLEYKKKIIVYATDNELIVDEEMPNFNEKNINNLFLNADILIADCQYTYSEYKTKIGWGHSSAAKLVEVSKKFGVKQLVLYHHDPFHDDEKIEDMVKSAQIKSKNEITIYAAEEGMILVI